MSKWGIFERMEKWQFLKDVLIPGLLLGTFPIYLTSSPLGTD